MIPRSALRSAARTALCALGLVTATLAVDSVPAAAAVSVATVRHKPGKPHASTSHARPSHGTHTRGSASRAGHGTATHSGRSTRGSKHHAKRPSTRSARHHGRRRESEAQVADQQPEQLPVAPVIPQFALPDLAVSAATYPAGATLAGFGGPTETAMIPASSAVRTLRAITTSAASLLDALVNRARGQLGTRYVFGGAEPGAGLDCSSFARYAMEALGVRLPRTANQQAQIGRAIPRDANLLRPGDLLTFGSRTHVSHVGIYLGAGRFIHASVKHGAIIETTIERNRSLFRRWQGARRLLAAVDDSAEDAGHTGG